MKINRASLFFICTLILYVASFGCESSDDNKNEQRPVVTNLGVESFDLAKVAAIDAKPFIPFGGTLTETTKSPAFEYLVDENAEVTSLTAGTISTITPRVEQNDFSVVITPTNAPNWMVIHDHVKELTVKQGDVVAAGQKLGTAGTWFGGLGRTEVQVMNTSDNLSYCPVVVFDSSVSRELELKIKKLMSDWEAFKNDPNAYDESKMPYPGCFVEKM